MEKTGNIKDSDMIHLISHDNVSEENEAVKYPTGEGQEIYKLHDVTRYRHQNRNNRLIIEQYRDHYS